MLFDFSSDQVFQTPDLSILPLGESISMINDIQLSNFKSKIAKKHFDKVPSVWVTLGWGNDKELKLSGKLYYSQEGNDFSSGRTLSEINLIREFNPVFHENNSEKVIERYIDFNSIDFKFTEANFDLEEIPQLRLSLFVEPEEGAIVYYQYCQSNRKDNADDVIEYVLPQKTDSLYSTNRDRLDYVLPIVPKEQVEFVEELNSLKLGKEDSAFGFVVKILTFKRKKATAGELFKEVTSIINEQALQKENITRSKNSKGQNIFKQSLRYFGEKKYGLMMYDRSDKILKTVSTNEIDSSKKTLLLIHGTFSCTATNFKELLDDEVLHQLLASNVVEQILAFDHPTISHDVFDNADWLYKTLGNLRFQHSVHLLSYSRGTLVAKWLAADRENKHFVVDKLMSFSGANGVAYFKLGSSLAKGLSVLKMMKVSGVEEMITGLAQFSAEFFLQLPGSQQMTPNHPKLLKILNAVPNPNTKYLAVCADWNKGLIKNSLKSAVAQISDGYMKLILGKKHDWVVGLKEQSITPNNAFPVIEIMSDHVSNFDLDYVQKDGVRFDTHQLIYNYFKTE